ncbi:hypothetical protein cyc_03423 [Cyclospora cayetanensis]|uniref:Uncharacterized protein n=1 Tax=Cyclospora cayetanensis TaxID=88456 RepID=A0A1D3CWC9_9EIME|nr:hypothetical protein cyc_03423 [Cyclospora cayetanensis]
MERSPLMRKATVEIQRRPARQGTVSLKPNTAMQKTRSFADPRAIPQLLKQIHAVASLLQQSGTLPLGVAQSSVWREFKASVAKETLLWYSQTQNQRLQCVLPLNSYIWTGKLRCSAVESTRGQTYGAGLPPFGEAQRSTTWPPLFFICCYACSVKPHKIDGRVTQTHLGTPPLLVSGSQEAQRHAKDVVQAATACIPLQFLVAYEIEDDRALLAFLVTQAAVLAQAAHLVGETG